MNNKILTKSIDPIDGAILLTCKRYRKYELKGQRDHNPIEYICRVENNECPVYLVFNRRYKECDGTLRLDWSSRLTHYDVIDILLRVEEQDDPF